MVGTHEAARRSAAAGAALLALTAVATAQQQDPEAAQQGAMKTAVTKGVRYLIEQQQPDGSWRYENAPLKLTDDAFPMTQGVTALCAFTLLKCGIGPDQEPVAKAFERIHAQELRWTYAVGCVLLALEAKTNFDPDRDPIAPGGSRERKKPGRPDRRDLELAARCVEWLAAHQREAGLWRYAGGSDEDVSNAQYAMLGLDAAERMGVRVPREVYEKAAARLLECLREGDEQVRAFPIPGADHTFRDLEKIEQRLRKEIKKVERKFKRADDTDSKGLTRDDHMRTAERKAAEEITESMSRDALIARGWAYFPPGVPGDAWKTTVNGSMTCSALASLFICKARLERTPRYERELKRPIDAALRHGAAWMAKNFAVDRNPGGKLHHFYYLYGLERAGVLGLIQRFGDHEWFDEGVTYLLKAQQKGGWWRASQGTSGPIPDTCFALLFLARGTTPVVELPGRVMTGGGRTYGDE